MRFGREVIRFASALFFITHSSSGVWRCHNGVAPAGIHQEVVPTATEGVEIRINRIQETEFVIGVGEFAL